MLLSSPLQWIQIQQLQGLFPAARRVSEFSLLESNYFGHNFLWSLNHLSLCLRKCSQLTTYNRWMIIFQKFYMEYKNERWKGNYLSHSDVHDWIVMRKKIVKENTTLSKNERFFSHNWSLHLHQPPPQKNHYCSRQIERLKLQLLVLLESVLPFFWKFSPLLSFTSLVAS